MLGLLAIALLAQQPYPPPVLLGGPEGPLFSSAAGGAALPSLPFIFAPANGVGMGAECAGTPITGDEGETITFTRSTTSVCTRSDGGLVALSANQPNVQFDTGVLGFLPETSAQNLVLHASDLTQAAWVATNMTTAKTATGPFLVANSATTLTATAANATIFQTLSAASAARVTSTYVKRRTGVGPISITRNGGSSYTAITTAVGAEWGRVTQVNFAGLTSSVLNPVVGFKIDTSGDAIDVYVFQDEAGPIATSIIDTGGTPVTRSPDVATFVNPLSGNTSTQWVMQATGTPSNGGSWGSLSLVRHIVGHIDVTANRIQFFGSGSTGRVSILVNDGTLSKTFQTTNGIGSGSHAATMVNDGGTLTIAFDGVNAVGGITGAGTGIVTTQLPTLSLGGAAGGSQFNGVITKLCIDDRVPARCP